MMTSTQQLVLLPANDDVVGHGPGMMFRVSRRAEHRLMLVIGFLVGAVLISCIADGYIMAEALPDLTTFSGRV